MYGNDFDNENYNVERRPSNLDRDAKLTYQSAVISKKRVKDKIESLNTGVYQGGLSSHTKSRFLNANQLLPSPKNEFFVNTARSDYNNNNNTFVSQSNIDFTHRYEIEEVEPPVQIINNNNKKKSSSSSKKQNGNSKNPYENEGYQKDDGVPVLRTNTAIRKSPSERVIAVVDKKQHLKNNNNNNNGDDDDEIEDVEEDVYYNHHNVSSKNKSSTKFKSNSEILGNNYNNTDNGAIAPIEMTNEEEGAQNSADPNLEIDYSIFQLLNSNDSIDFILKPAPIGLVIKCQVYRHKGLYPEYKMCLQREDASLILLLSAKKRKRTKTPGYIINAMTLNQTEKNTRELSFAKLKSNLLGTQFTLYDNGVKPSAASGSSNNNNNSGVHDDDDDGGKGGDGSLRREFASVLYGLNVLGFKGPRQMKVLIPGMDENYKRKDIQPVNESESIIQTWKRVETLIDSATKHQSKMNIMNENSNETVIQVSNKEAELTQSANIIRLANKSPMWNQTLRSFALNFNGRVTQASVKNFQIIHPVDIDYIVMQFGKVSKDVYTCDYSYPLCALQAFGIALSSLDNKLACD